MQYIAGYIAKKYQKDCPQLGVPVKINEHDYNLPTWVEHLSYGGLIKPTDDWLNIVIKLNRSFEKYHGESGIKRGKNVVYNLLKIVKLKYNVSLKVIKTFLKLRTKIKINYFNINATNSKNKVHMTTSRNVQKKMKKIVN